jgi:hypothetical protein
MEFFFFAIDNLPSNDKEDYPVFWFCL